MRRTLTQWLDTRRLAALFTLALLLPAAVFAEGIQFSGELTAPISTKVSDDVPQINVALEIAPTRLAVRSESPKIWRKEAKRILHKLVGDDLHAYLGFEPELAILETPTLDAYVSSSGTLTMSHGMLVFLNSESEFAFLIAHEVAHMMLGHHEHRHADGMNLTSFTKQELEADQIALKLIQEAGFSSSAALGLIKRLGNFGKDRGLAFEEMYPSLRSRRLALQLRD